MPVLFYDIIFFILAVLYFPFLILRGKWHKGFRQRMGFFSKKDADALAGRHHLWIHAVSVGEVLAVKDLAVRLSAGFPGEKIVLTTVTPTGFKVARSSLPPEVTVLYAPLDLSFIVHKFIRLMAPKIYIAAETEIWPNLFMALKRNHVPVVLVNGRISDRTYYYYRAVKFLLRPVLNAVNCFCMQSPRDARRIVSLGVPESRVHAVGNIKFDGLHQIKEYRREDFGYGPENIIWIAGSTHPGEEDVVLRIFKMLRREFPALRLIIAPRHIERAGEVSAFMKKQGVAPVLFSPKAHRAMSADDVLLIDEIGHLRSFYAMSDIVFIGKSLLGKGGQNIIEPAFFGKPVLVGPHMQNFRQVTAILKEADAMIQVHDEKALAGRVRALAADPSLRADIGRRAREVVLSSQGATAKTLDFIAQTLSIQ